MCSVVCGKGYFCDSGTVTCEPCSIIYGTTLWFEKCSENGTSKSLSVLPRTIATSHTSTNTPQELEQGAVSDVHKYFQFTVLSFLIITLLFVIVLIYILRHLKWQKTVWQSVEGYLPVEIVTGMQQTDISSDESLRNDTPHHTGISQQGRCLQMVGRRTGGDEHSESSSSISTESLQIEKERRVISIDHRLQTAKIQFGKGRCSTDATQIKQRALPGNTQESDTEVEQTPVVAKQNKIKTKQANIFAQGEETKVKQTSVVTKQNETKRKHSSISTLKEETEVKLTSFEEKQNRSKDKRAGYVRNQGNNKMKRIAVVTDQDCVSRQHDAVEDQTYVKQRGHNCKFFPSKEEKKTGDQAQLEFSIANHSKSCDHPFRAQTRRDAATSNNNAHSLTTENTLVSKSSYSKSRESLAGAAGEHFGIVEGSSDDRRHIAFGDVSLGDSYLLRTITDDSGVVTIYNPISNELHEHARIHEHGENSYSDWNEDDLVLDIENNDFSVHEISLVEGEQMNPVTGQQNYSDIENRHGWHNEYRDGFRIGHLVNNLIYEQLQSIPWVMGYHSNGRSISVYADLDEHEAGELLEELISSTGQPKEKFKIKHAEL